MSSKDNDEEHVMHSKSSYIEILMNDKAEEVAGELLQSLLSSIIFDCFIDSIINFMK